MEEDASLTRKLAGATFKRYVLVTNEFIVAPCSRIWK